MKALLLFVSLTAILVADSPNHPTGNRTTPPTINSVSPRGVSRGATVELTIEGFNLANASAIYFSEPGINGRLLRVKELPDLAEVRLGSNNTPSTIDLGPLPPRNQVTVEVDVEPGAAVGPVNFRLHTPLGTSPVGRLLIEPYYGESPDREPNDTPDNALETYLPTILVGAISRPGDLDYYKIEAKAGEQLVFENGATSLGSSLQPLVSLIASDYSLVNEFGSDGGPGVSHFAHRFEEAGTFYIRVSDYQQSGRASHFYRIKVGRFPLAVSAYPLGLKKGKNREVALKGFNVGSNPVAVKGEPSLEDENAVIFRPKTRKGASFYRVKLALGDEPEIESRGANVSLASGQTISTPVTINGRIAAPENNMPAANYFRFEAHRGEQLVFEVNARRLGSELDSLIEVLDSKGRPIERVTVRPILETSTTLRDHDSVRRGIRIQSWTGFAVGDYVMIGGEILRVEALPRTPDDDMVFEAFGGQRLAFLDTTAEAHANGKSVYKVQLHPAGTQFTDNALPLVRLHYRNDDGGPGYGKDSLLHFTAPADGDYIVRIRDVCGLSGEDYAYRLTVRHPRPDFRLSVNPENPNVPVGSSIPLTITAFRMDDFDGQIEASLVDLPAGLHATTGIIAPGQTPATLLLSAEETARLNGAVPLKVVGRAKIGNHEVVHFASPEKRLKLISLMPKADIVMTAETREVILEPGSTAEVTVSVKRQNDFGGRVPVEVRNLPPCVRVLDVGLNGVLLNEDETRRSFVLEALPSAEPIEQSVYICGRVETRSNLQTSYAAEQPILLTVKPQGQTAGLAGPK